MKQFTTAHLRGFLKKIVRERRNLMRWDRSRINDPMAAQICRRIEAHLSEARMQNHKNVCDYFLHWKSNILYIIPGSGSTHQQILLDEFKDIQHYAEQQRQAESARV